MSESIYDLTRRRTILLRGIHSSDAEEWEKAEWQVEVDAITEQLRTMARGLIVEARGEK